MALELLIDGFIHPVFLLLTAAFFEVAVFVHKFEILIYHLPHLIDAEFVVARVGEHLRTPATRRRGKQMQCAAELGGSQLGAFHIIAVALVDNYAIGHLHDAALYALQLIAGAGKLYEQEEVDHRVNGGFALPHTHGFYKDVIVAGCLAQHYGFAGLASHTAQRPCRWAGTYERIFLHRKLLHTGLVAKYRTLGEFATRVDGKHGKFAAAIEHMQSENVDRRTLAGTGHAGDAYALGVAGIWQTFLYHFLCQALVFGQLALHERHSLSQHGNIALAYAFHILCCGDIAATRACL